MSFQKLVIVGRVGRDADMRYTPAGVAVCDWSVATSKVSGKGESRKEETTWFKVTAWRDQAETHAQYVKKGMLILIEGTVKASAYMKDGKAVASLEMTADRVQYLGKGSEDSGPGAPENNMGDDANENDLPF